MYKNETQMTLKNKWFKKLILQILQYLEAVGVLEWVEAEEAPLVGRLLEPVIPDDRLESFGLDGIGGLDFWAVNPSQLFQHPSFLRN